MTDVKPDWTLVSHLECENGGQLSAIAADSDNNFDVQHLSSNNASGNAHPPWFLGLTSDAKIILFDPMDKSISNPDKLPLDAIAAYVYQCPTNNLAWFMNDGDKEFGNDQLNCNGNGSTVTIVDLYAQKHIKTLCVGSGHHVTTFIEPSDKFPDMPKVAYVSNLLSGNICVIDNDCNNAETYLTIITEINLAEPEKEKNGNAGVPNNAFPHGKQYSSSTGKVYSLNNGYGTVAVINPMTQEIENRIPLKGASNLLLSPCGKFLIGKGADRKSNAEHVIGKLSIIDAISQKVLHTFDIPDLYPSTYRFNPAGTKLYITSAATGKDQQKTNLKINTLLIYDASQLPTLLLIKTITIGNADCGRRPIAFPINTEQAFVFLPNPTDGSVTIVDGQNDQVIQTLKIADSGGKEFNFSFCGTSVSGA